MSAGNGGPAFPLPHDVALVAGLQQSLGMTLRDYFAAKVMAATVAARDMQCADRSACVASILADEAYELADAMLEAREEWE